MSDTFVIKVFAPPVVVSAYRDLRRFGIPRVEANWWVAGCLAARGDGKVLFVPDRPAPVSKDGQ